MNYGLLKLGVFFVILNCIHLNSMQIHDVFTPNYFDLLIFCYQNVDKDIIKYFQTFVFKYQKRLHKPTEKHHPISDEFSAYAFLFFYL